MEKDLVKIAHNVYVELAELRLLLFFNDKACKELYTTLEFIIDNCKRKIDDITDLIERYSKEEKKIDSIEKVIEKYIENIIENILDEERE